MIDEEIEEDDEGECDEYFYAGVIVENSEYGEEGHELNEPDEEEHEPVAIALVAHEPHVGPLVWIVVVVFVVVGLL